jgi:hypothetical protein
LCDLYRNGFVIMTQVLKRALSLLAAVAVLLSGGVIAHGALAQSGPDYDYYKFTPGTSPVDGASDSTEDPNVQMLRPPALYLSPSTLTWSGQASSLGSRSVTLTNNGEYPAQSITIRITSGSSYFRYSGGCSQLNPGSSCSITITPTISTAGNFNGTLDASPGFGTGATANLVASGITVPRPAALSVSPSSITWTGTVNTVNSQVRSVTVTNTGDLTAGTITGGMTGANAFAIQTAGTTCGVTPLAGRASCIINVKPVVPGPGTFNSAMPIRASAGPTASVNLIAGNIAADCTNGSYSYSNPRNPIDVCAGVGANVTITRTCSGSTPSYSIRYQLRSDYAWQPGYTTVTPGGGTSNWSWAYGRDVSVIYFARNSGVGTEAFGVGMCKSPVRFGTWIANPIPFR